MAKTLIIGGTRFLGPPVIELLQADGHAVTIFNRGNNYNSKIPEGIKVIKGDRTKVEDMERVLQEKFDYIYDMCCYDKEDADKLLRFADPSSHIIFLSTAAVYQKPALYPLRENSKLGPWESFGSYGTDKAAAEDAFIRFAERNKTKLTIFRPVYLLGKNNYFDRENYFFSRLETGSPILIPGNGRALVQFAFDQETARAFTQVPANQQDQIEVVNVGGDDFITLNDIVDLCAGIVGKEARKVSLDTAAFNLEEEAFYDDLYPFPNLNFIASNEKLKSSYGISFTPLEQGLRNIYEHWKMQWSGDVNVYPKESRILKKLGA